MLWFRVSQLNVTDEKQIYHREMVKTGRNCKENGGIHTLMEGIIRPERHILVAMRYSLGNHMEQNPKKYFF
jgi:hypothetical protein